MSENKKLPKEKRDEYKQAFACFDQNGDGVIDSTELGGLVKVLMPNNKHPLASAKRMLKEYDLNNDGVMQFDEFVEMMVSVEHYLNEDDIEKLFKSHAKEGGKDTISVSVFREILHELGLEASDEEMGTMLKEAGLNEDSQISFEKFKVLMHGD